MLKLCLTVIHKHYFVCILVQVRTMDSLLHPERLKVITQQVEEEQALFQSQTLLRLQQIHAMDRQTHSSQVSSAHKYSLYKYHYKQT